MPGSDGGDPWDTPVPAKIYGHNVVQDHKAILLISGNHVANWVIKRDPQHPGSYRYEQGALGTEDVLPVHDQVPNQTEFRPSEPERSVWRDLIKVYTDPNTFASPAENWKFYGIRPFSKADIIESLEAIRATRPKGVAVHYFGHGDSIDNYATPYLELSGFTEERMGIANNSPKVFVPSTWRPWPSNVRSELCLCSDVVDELSKFPDDVAKTFVIDGCDCAPAKDLAAGHANLSIVVAVSEKAQMTHGCKFSGFWVSAVTTACFAKSSDGGTTARLAAVDTINGQLDGLAETTVAPSGGAIQKASASG